MFCLSTFIQLKSEDCDATGFILYTILKPEPHSLLLYTYKKKNQNNVKIPKLFSLKKKTTKQKSRDRVPTQATVVDSLAVEI